MKTAPPPREFNSLSARDLLEAREAYHVHLSNKEFVVATAIGRYLIRKTDENWKTPGKHAPRGRGEPRTLENSSDREWSWPCVLVFVDEWRPLDYFATMPEEAVPPLLYLPDGRVVPTCVVLIQGIGEAPGPLENLVFPSELVGGGYPIVSDVQQEEHLGSLGCLVTNGDVVYALTNRHVTGEPGRPIFSLVNGKRQPVGVSDRRQLGKKPFSQVYPGWPGERVVVNLDAGLIKIDDLTRWTAQVYGLGELGDIIDMNTDAISLDLIGCPVRAFGAASGPLAGRIDALFYRYRSLGGLDYVADLLIGPLGEGSAVTTRRGDSGTLWVYDTGPGEDEASAKERRRGEQTAAADGPRRALRPLAMEWGGQNLLGPAGRTATQFALATFLSTLCRELDVEVVRDVNIGHSEYWGKIGHFKIGAKACELVQDARLKTLMMANQLNIGYADADIRSKSLAKMGQAFIPLADVPDLVWKKSPVEHPQHFADMDQPGEGAFAGKTLLDLTEGGNNLDPRTWNEFYAGVGVDKRHRGSLPFRVWQVYEGMVRFLKAKDVERFLCAAGVLSHYVGDACQPLHVSSLHHGRPGHPGEDKVHSNYEEGMLALRAADFLEGLNKACRGLKPRGGLRGGEDAAKSTVELMRRTIGELPPMEIIDAFNAVRGAERKAHLWEVVGTRTIECVRQGCVSLASLWESAWQEGQGGKIRVQDLKRIPQTTLARVYNEKAFLTPVWLDAMTNQGLGVAAPADTAGRPAGRTGRRRARVTEPADETPPQPEIH
jgi:hypothetical protein